MTRKELIAECRRLGDPTPGDGWRRLLWQCADEIERLAFFAPRRDYRKGDRVVRLDRPTLVGSVGSVGKLVEVWWDCNNGVTQEDRVGLLRITKDGDE